MIDWITIQAVITINTVFCLLAALLKSKTVSNTVNPKTMLIKTGTFSIALYLYNKGRWIYFCSACQLARNMNCVIF